MSLTADLNQLKRLRADLVKMSERAKDTNTLLGLAGPLALKEVDDNFKQSGPPGEPWLALKWRTGKPLQDTGALRSSIKWSIDGGTLKVESKLPYSGVHQDGATIISKGFMVIPDSGLPNSERRTFQLRSYKDTLVGTNNGAGYVAFEMTGKNNKVRLLAHLTKSVTIPARPFLVMSYRAIGMDGTIPIRITKYITDGR